MADTIAVDGNTLDVTSNPFTSGPYSVGLHSVTIAGFTGPFTIKACVPPPTIFPLCQAGSNAYDWQVSSETQQDNWNIDYRYSLVGVWYLLPSSNAAIDFETPSAGGKTLYVRWDSYPDAGTSTAQADTTLCS